MKFFICALILAVYGLFKFKQTKVLYPSIIFSGMWAFSFFLIFLARLGMIISESDIDYMFTYAEPYCVCFTVVSVCSFLLAHRGNKTIVNDLIDKKSLEILLKNYRWLMYLTFAFGIARIAMFASSFDIDNLTDYRQTFIESSLSGILGWVFRIGNWILLFADVYLVLLGFYHGKTRMIFGDVVLSFVLFSPMLMSTGGRLFIVYYSLFYFVSFFLGRACAKHKQFLDSSEKRYFIIVVSTLIVMVSVYQIIKIGDQLSSNIDTYLSKYLYVTDGIMSLNWCMEAFGQDLQLDYGTNSFGFEKGHNLIIYRNLYQDQVGAAVYSILLPLYLDFGYYGSLIVWFCIAFIFEKIAIWNLKNITIIKLLVVLVVSKIEYESVIFNSFNTNYPFVELVFLLYVFRHNIFGLFYKR